MSEPAIESETREMPPAETVGSPQRVDIVPQAVLNASLSQSLALGTLQLEC